MKLAIKYKEDSQRLRIYDADTGENLEGVRQLAVYWNEPGKPTVELVIEVASVDIETKSASAMATTEDGRVYEGPVDQMGYDPTLTALSRIGRIGKALGLQD